MDWHPVISVQQQTPNNDFCYFSISNVLFEFWAFFSKTGKTRVSHRVKMMSRGDPDVKDDPNDQLTRWPNDPVPRLVRSRPACGASELCTRSLHSKGHFWREDRDAAWSQLQWPVVLFTARRNMQRKCNTTWLPVSRVCTVWEAGVVSKRMGGSRWFSTRGQRWR